MLSGGGKIEVEVIDQNSVARLRLAEVKGVIDVEVVEDPDMGAGIEKYILSASEEPSIRERIFDKAVECGFKLVSLGVKTISLEDVFVDITTKEEKQTEGNGKEEEEDKEDKR